MGTLVLRALRRAALPACCTALVAAAPAGAEPSSAGHFSARFSSLEPHAPTGLVFRQVYEKPDDPDAKPSPVRRFLFAAPEGSTFDGSAVAPCTASDLQFMLRGKAACPPESVVGEGFLTVMTGLPDERPFPVDATVFNSGDGVIELFTDQSTGIFLAVERAVFRGANAFEVPSVGRTPGGPPDFESAAREAYLEFPVSRGPDGRSFITTPPECPATRRWTARFEWTNADGNSYSSTSDMPCAPTDARPHLALTRRCAGDGRLVMGLAGEVDGVRDVNFKLDRRLVRRDTRPPFRQTLDRRAVEGSDARRLRAVAYLHDGEPFRVILRRSLPRCGLR